MMICESGAHKRRQTQNTSLVRRGVSWGGRPSPLVARRGPADIGSVWQLSKHLVAAETQKCTWAAGRQPHMARADSERVAGGVLE